MRLILALSLAALVATPALATDKLIPANATGAIAEHKGKAWREPLTNCAGFHSWNLRRLKAAGDTAGAWAETDKIIAFTDAAAGRISADNGVAVDQAKAENRPRIQNVVNYLDMEIEPPDPVGWTKVCTEYLAAYRRAFP